MSVPYTGPICWGVSAASTEEEARREHQDDYDRLGVTGRIIHDLLLKYDPSWDSDQRMLIAHIINEDVLKSIERQAKLVEIANRYGSMGYLSVGLFDLTQADYRGDMFEGVISLPSIDITPAELDEINRLIAGRG